jgi:hypothetical protein
VNNAILFLDVPNGSSIFGAWDGRFPRPGLGLLKRLTSDGKGSGGGGGGNKGGDREKDGEGGSIAVAIERPSMNSRKISASITVNRPVAGRCAAPAGGLSGSKRETGLAPAASRCAVLTWERRCGFRPRRRAELNL